MMWGGIVILYHYLYVIEHYLYVKEIEAKMNQGKKH